MRATHLVADTEVGVVYEFSVDGDNYHWRMTPEDAWRGPHYGWLKGTYSRGEWVTKKVSTFKGNK